MNSFFVLQVAFISNNMNLRNSVIGAIEHTLQECIVPITERAIKVAITTSEQIIKKVRTENVTIKQNGCLRLGMHMNINVPRNIIKMLEISFAQILTYIKTLTWI